MEPRPILLIEGAPLSQLSTASALEGAGYAVSRAETPADATVLVRDQRFAAVIVELTEDGSGARALLAESLRFHPARPVIVTADATLAGTEPEFLRAGARAFLVKPFADRALLDSLAATTGPMGPAAGNGSGNLAPPGAFIGQSPAMAAVYAKIRSVGPSDAPVFITGESGTGKALCAREIHRLSARAPGPFVELNCSALAADHPEAELFGHVPDAYPGARSARPGALAAADGGTLFLDDFCALAPALQSRLLRFLQTATFQPLGADEPRSADVRLICATAEDATEAMRQGRLREDLYYRLNVIPVAMPPLRARGEDVNLIAEWALAAQSAEERRHFTGLSLEVRELFRSLPWPGNVRQLLNVVRQIVILHDGGTVTPAMLPDELLAERTEPAAPAIPKSVQQLMGKSLAEVERLVIEAAIALHGGSVARAARTLDVAPSTLYRKMESWAAADARDGLK